MLFGSSGIRKPFSTDFVKTALNIGFTLGNKYNRIIIGRDTQHSSEPVYKAVIAGLLSTGVNVYAAGIISTPGIGYTSRNFDIGCMITASHNGGKYGGIKLFNQNGSSFTKKQQYQIENTINANHPTPGIGECHNCSALFEYINKIRHEFNWNTTPTPPIKSVLIDGACGTGTSSTPHIIHNSTTSWVHRDSEPSEKNTSYIPEMMKIGNYDIAILHDEDADRMMAYDNNRKYISGDHLLMLFITYMNIRKMVTTSDASMALDDISTVQRTPVGDSYVSEKLCSWGEFGGEPSGALIFPNHSLCPDGPYAAAKLCEIMKEWDIHEIINEFPKYTMLRESYPCKHANKIMLKMGVNIPTNGYRDENNFGWFFIRSSGTEPKIRITVEGYTSSDAKHLMDLAKNKIYQYK